MRTKNTIRNLIVAWAGQLTLLLCTFVSRSVFVKVLPAEYLGISGLFGNILSMLSLIDLGIGVSIAYYLYEPLANNDEKKLCQLMNYFKKMYTIIGVTVLVLGASLTPFLEWFIKEKTTIPHIHLIYILYVLDSGLTYFGVYKSSLINADQKGYIVSFYNNLIKIIQTVVAIVLLVVTENYFVYYSVTLVATVTYNIMITRKANRLYPFLAKHKNEEVDASLKKTIQHNIFAMMCHKIRYVFINFTDNILISKLVSIVTVGLYSNYSMILINLNKVVAQVFNALTASVGNFNVSESDEKKEKLLYTLLFMDFLIYNFCSICLYVLFNPFIKLWLGENYVMSQFIVFILVLNNYLQGMRKVIQTFKDANGLYQNDKYNALFEAFLNLVLSIILAKYWGIAGIFAGTIASYVFTGLWIEPFVLFRHGFKASLLKYFRVYVCYMIEAVVCVGGAYYLTTFLPEGLGGFILRILVCGVVWIVSVLLFHGRSEEFKTLLSKVLKRKKAR